MPQVAGAFCQPIGAVAAGYAYWIKLGANAAMAIWRIFLFDAATAFSEGLFDYATENDSTVAFADIGEPPSSAQSRGNDF